MAYKLLPDCWMALRESNRLILIEARDLARLPGHPVRSGKTPRLL